MAMSKQMIRTKPHDIPIIQYTCDHCLCYDAMEALNDTIFDIEGVMKELEQCGWISRYIDGQKYDFCCEDCYLEAIKKN